MIRTPEVLDCWFESGAMPYAQKHYPFENEERFINTFPADFIVEYIAQTRGWFYTLHVLSTALLNKPAFTNCVCTGTILAEDGTKMSKSKKNYPDPTIIFDKYGSDAMRFYLMSGSIMNGENLNFAEKGVEEVMRKLLLPLLNAYSFFATYANIDKWKPIKNQNFESLDNFIFLHGFNGSPKEDWFPWIKKKLETKEDKVQVPELPNSDNPKLKDWLEKLSKTTQKEKLEDLIIVGHSLGGSLLLRFLEELPKNKKIKKAIFIATVTKKLKPEK